MKKQKNESVFNKHGFTLMELLVVISVIAITAAVGFVALNPTQRLEDSRNAARWTDVGAIVNAVKMDEVDNGGSFLTSVADATSSLNFVIGTASTGCDSGCGAITTQVSCVDLTGLVTEGYMGKIPVGPDTAAAATKTSYYLNKATTGLVTVGACASSTISTTK